MRQLRSAAVLTRLRAAAAAAAALVAQAETRAAAAAAAGGSAGLGPLDAEEEADGEIAPLHPRGVPPAGEAANARPLRTAHPSPPPPSLATPPPPDGNIDPDPAAWDAHQHPPPPPPPALPAGLPPPFGFRAQAPPPSLLPPPVPPLPASHGGWQRPSGWGGFPTPPGQAGAPYGGGGGGGGGLAAAPPAGWDNSGWGLGGDGGDDAPLPFLAPTSSSYHTVRDRFSQREAARVYHRRPRCEGYDAPAPNLSGSYGYYPSPFRPTTTNFSDHFVGSENTNGGGARNAQEAVILYQLAAWLGNANNGLVELETAIREQRLAPADAASAVAGLRTCVFQSWVFATTRFEVLALMRQRPQFALDLARAILSPRDTGMGGVATAQYHQAAAIAQATTIARDEANRANRASRGGSGDGPASDSGRGRGHGYPRGRRGKRYRDDGGGDPDHGSDRGRGRGRGR